MVQRNTITDYQELRCSWSTYPTIGNGELRLKKEVFRPLIPSVVEAVGINVDDFLRNVGTVS